MGGDNFHFLPQAPIEEDFPPTPGTMMIEGTSRYFSPQHFLKAHRLGAQLYFVGTAGPARPHLVFYRIRGTVRQELYPIRLAHQAQSLRPDGQAALYADLPHLLASRFIHMLVRPAAPQGVQVLFEDLLHVYEGALPRAVRVVLERRDWHEILVSLKYRHRRTTPGLENEHGNPLCHQSVHVCTRHLRVTLGYP